MFRIAFIAVLLAAASSHAADRGSVARGQKAFKDFGCWKCHGTVGQGTGSGAKLAPEVLPADAYVTFLRNTPRSMPRYSEQLISDAQIADIHAYLESQPKSPPLDSIAALKNIRGK